jgi:hypothetical protein
MKLYRKKQHVIKDRPAVTLVLTLVVLVVLTTILCALAARLATLKHRRQYMIDYQVSRYACDSGVKYAIAMAQNIKLDLLERKGLADFSDIFTMDKNEYGQFLSEWAREISIQMELADLEEESDDDSELDGKNQKFRDMSQFIKRKSFRQRSSNIDPNSVDDMFEDDEYFEEDPYYIDPNDVVVPGPYGPGWPGVIEPIEFQIGKSKITIEIEDENAKMPLVWAITKDEKVARQASDAIEIFCEWMQMDPCEIEDLAAQLSDIGEIKEFDIKAKPITITEKITRQTPSRRSKKSRRSSSRRRNRRARTTTKKTTRPAVAHTCDFARLLHSSIVDLEKLAEPVPLTGRRYESAIKYLGLWGSSKVNINTAPRHVLEAAFTFGGDATEIANEIIEKRKIKPFKDIDQLKDELYGFSEEIDKTAPYITTASTFLSIRVTAWSGNAKTSSVATIIKNGKKIEKIAIISN